MHPCKKKHQKKKRKTSSENPGIVITPSHIPPDPGRLIYHRYVIRTQA
jgi:phosphoglucomutase